jgi:hypothetical protein
VNVNVVDTNVLVAANGLSSASVECAAACATRLRQVVELQEVAVDDAFRILREYSANAHVNGRPGPGDFFLRWMLQNRKNAGRVLSVHITPRPGATEDYEEFPSHQDLVNFDPSDRKFAAVANACQAEAIVLDATDSDWWDARAGFEESGVPIEFVCPDEIDRWARDRG